MDSNTEFQLFPYIGAGPLKFGMSPAQVQSVLDVAETVSVNHLGQRVEHRGFVTLGYSKDDESKLNHIGFGRQMAEVRYGDLKIFNEPYDEHHQHYVLRTLCADDAKPRFFLGTVFLFKLGFSLTGFQDEEEDDLAFAMFPKGEKDYLLENPRIKPFYF